MADDTETLNPRAEDSSRGGGVPAVAAEPWKPRANPWLIAVVVAMAAFMEVLDTGIANVEAMEGRGELGRRTARELDRLLVEIGDNGPGIPPEVQSHIFEPFITTKGVGDGTGQGLDTVCRIARNHHGEISVTSQPGDTRFQVYLPITQPKPSLG